MDFTKRTSREYTFLKSALCLEGRFMKNDQFLNWMKEKRESVTVKITNIRFDEMDKWLFDEKSNLVHESGKFFSIEGISVATNWGKVNHWTQPIINQPEVGFLGIITKEFDGVLHFLMQAKIEPGNINFVQLSPTLQATKSNYTKVHKGKSPDYLEYFNGTSGKKVRVLLDQLQSEQGARFIKKRNRNIIIEIFDDIELKDNFCWLSLGQIKALLALDNTINMDTRTVISGIPFGQADSKTIALYESLSPISSGVEEFRTGLLISSIETDRHVMPMEEIISWITELKCRYELDVERIRLDKVEGWLKTDTEIYHKDRKYFKVIPVRAEISSREVTSWTQPLVESVQEGLIAFLVKKINGCYHFLVQAKLEAGNFDIIELAPTVQCLTGNYRDAEGGPAYLNYVLEATEDQTRFDTYQSEEGGRFYREQNRNMIIEVEDEFDIEVPDNFAWMTLKQINTFIDFNNYLNIQARSLLAAIRFI